MCALYVLTILGDPPSRKKNKKGSKETSIVSHFRFNDYKFKLIKNKNKKTPVSNE